MLIIANGTFKSGSSWQFRILRNLVKFSEIPAKYHRKKMKKVLKISKIKEFLNSDLIKQNTYVAKAHIYKKKNIELLRNHPEVKIFLIKRDLKDAIVSHYHHFNNIRRVNLSFKIYYWFIGRFKAMQMIKYNKNWEIDAKNVFYSKFEDLKNNFDSEIKKYGLFVGKKLTNKEIQNIREKTSIKNIRKKTKKKWFFRKGEIGDYINYFNKSMLNDINKISKKISLFDKLIYYLIIELHFLLSKR